MNDLPVKVLLNVFSFVPKEELITTIPQVCQLWKDVVDDPSLFTTLDLVNEVPDTETSIRLLSAATWLTSLKLSGRTDTDVLIQHIGVNHPRLVKLVFDKCRGSRSKMDVSEMQLRYLVRRCSTLQQFSLLETLCYNEGLHTEIGVNLHDLRVLEITYSLQFNSESLVSITKYCNRIEKINLNSSGSDPIFSNVVANFCGKFKDSLTSFMIEDATWTNATLAALSRCRNVKELVLGLWSGVITDVGIMSLCQMPKLESLAIKTHDKLTHRDLVRLLENVSMKRLVKLGLCVYNLGDLVAASISLLPNLKDLDIWGGEITIEGLMSLSKIPNLARLTITYDTNLTPHGWIRFFSIYHVQQNMTHLKLLWCKNVNDEVKQAISQNLRNLQQLELSRTPN